MAAIKVATGLGYGLVTFLFLKNAEGVGEFASEIARTTVHFWSRSPKDKRLLDGNSRDMGDLSDKLDRIALMKRDTVHVHHGPNSWSGWVTTAVGGTICIAVIVHMTGLFDMSGIMYVTQSKFKSATDALKEGIDAVSKALNKARVELLERIGVLEKSLEDVSADLKNQITLSTESVRDDLAKVSNEVRDVGSIAEGLESKLGTIEGGVGDLRSALERANRGIHLLCHVVADSYRQGSSSQKDQRWYSDLITFTKTEPPTLDNKTEVLKQIKENGEGPVMRFLSSGKNVGGNADNGGGLATFKESLTRQLSKSGVLDSS